MKSRTYLRKDNDKGIANNVIRFMVKDNRSVTDIQHHINGIFGTSWDTGTIRKKMRDVQNSRPAPDRIPATVKTKVKYKRNPIVALAKLKTSKTMPFGSLCEHIASFFEPIVDAPRGRDMNQEWKFAKDKVELWNSIRQLLGTEKLCAIISKLTESESIAYSYCDRMLCLKNKNSSRKEWGSVYALYRQWRAVYLVS
jgi:hypothetical protein